MKVTKVTRKAAEIPPFLPAGPTPARSEVVYRSGPVEIDLAGRCVRRDGSERRLRPKTHALLVYLLEHRNRVVPREELMASIWPDTAVTDDTLVQSVRELRRAFGDSPENARYFRTYPRSGYRFVGPLEPNMRTDVSSLEARATRVEVEFEEEDGWGSLAPLGSFLGRRVTGVFLAVLACGAIAVAAWQLLIAPGTSLSGPASARDNSPVLLFGTFDNASRRSELDWLSDGLPNLLAGDLARGSSVQVWPREGLLDGRSAGSARPPGLDDVLRSARRRGAGTVLLGSFTSIGEQLRIDITVIDANSGTRILTDRLILDRLDHLLTHLEPLTVRIASVLGATGRVAEPLVLTASLEAYRYYTLGLAKVQAVRVTEAIDLFKRAVLHDPGFAMAHARIGYAYAMRWNHADEARPYLEKALSMPARLSDRDTSLVKAWLAVARYRFEEAVEGFRALLARYPGELEAYEALSVLLRGEGRLAEARAVLDQGLAVQPEAPGLLNRLVGLATVQGDHDTAIRIAHRVIELRPGDPNALDSLGLTYHCAGRYAEARDAYERALAIDPRFEVAVVHLGNVAAAVGQYDRALELFARYGEIAPGDSERGRAVSSQIRVWELKDNLGMADRGLQRLKELAPGHWQGQGILLALAKGNLAAAARLRREYPPAGDAIQRGMRSRLRETDVVLGRLALRLGHKGEALDHLRAALRVEGALWHVEDYETCLAEAYVDLGQFDDAVAEYHRILAYNPHRARARLGLAEAYAALGNVTRAREEARRFLEIFADADADAPELGRARHILADWTY